MSLSSTTLKLYLEFYATIEGAFEIIPTGPPPSPPARIKGTLSSFHVSMKAILAALETREPTKIDVQDLKWAHKAIGDLIIDKWVVDHFAKIEIDWHGAHAAKAAGLEAPENPLTLQQAIGLLLEGLERLTA